MKKLAIFLLLVASTSTFANGRHQHQDRRGDWVAPMLGGIVLGAIIARDQVPPPVYYPPVYTPPVYIPPVYTPPIYIPPLPKQSMCLVTVYDANTGSYRNEAVPCLKY